MGYSSCGPHPVLAYFRVNSNQTTTFSNDRSRLDIRVKLATLLDIRQARTHRMAAKATAEAVSSALASHKRAPFAVGKKKLFL